MGRQLDLFDNSPVNVSQYGTPIEAKSLARAADPVTSQVAAQEAAASAAVSRMHVQLAEWLSRQSEPMTANEIAERAKAQLQLVTMVETIRKRVGELEDLPASKLGHAVRACGVRRCEVTRKLATTFEVWK